MTKPRLGGKPVFLNLRRFFCSVNAAPPGGQVGSGREGGLGQGGVLGRGQVVRILSLGSLMLLPACTVSVGGDGRSVAEHNDDLRRSNQELRAQVEDTQAQIIRLQQELKSHRLDAQRGEDGVTPPMPDAVVPVLVGLEFARYSGPVDTDRDGIDDTLRLYLRPFDQKNRFRVVAGRVNAQLLSLIPDQPPRVLLDRTITPPQLDDAYRTGFTGDYYHVDVPLDDALFDILGDADRLTALVTLTPAGAGLPVSTQAVFPLQR